MKRNLLFILVLIISVGQCSAQHEADNWYFGNYAGITFSTNPPSHLPGSAMLQSEGCASNRYEFEKYYRINARIAGVTV